MNWVVIVAIIAVFGPVLLIFLIPIVAIIGGCAVGAVKEWRGGISRKARKQIEEETEMVQEMHKQLSRMEERIEALETILIEREREESAI